MQEGECAQVNKEKDDLCAPLNKQERQENTIRGRNHLQVVEGEMVSPPQEQPPEDKTTVGFLDGRARPLLEARPLATRRPPPHSALGRTFYCERWVTNTKTQWAVLPMAEKTRPGDARRWHLVRQPSCPRSRRGPRLRLPSQ